MKRFLFLAAAVFLIAAFAIIGCKGDDGNGDDSGKDPGNGNGNGGTTNPREVGWKTEPTGWTEWPASRMLVTVPTTDPAATITQNSDGSYKVVTSTRAWGIGEGQNRITFAFEPGVEFKGGIYVALTLPTGYSSSSWNRPDRVVVYAGGALQNNRFVQQDPNEGYTWMEGKVSLQWETASTTFEINHFELQVWFANSYAPDMPLEFTINKVLVKETVGTPGEPIWKPGFAAEPSWTNVIPLNTLTVSSIQDDNPTPITYSITPDNTLKIETEVRGTGDMQNRIIFSLPAGQTFRGLYFAFTLPEGGHSLSSKNKPYQLDLLSPQNNWDGSNQRMIKPTYWIEGPVSIMWNGTYGAGSPGIIPVTTPRNEFELQIRWMDQQPGEPFVFIVNKVLVNELNTTP